MIHRWDLEHAVAVAADGAVSIGSCSSDSPVSWTRLQFPDVIIAQKVSTRLPMLAILTSDNRILICFDPKERFEDITPGVHEILDPLDIRHISICDTQTIMIITSNRIVVIEADRVDEGRVTVKGRVICETQYEFDIHSTDWSGGSGTVRTSDNCLHRISKHRGRGSSLDRWSSEQLEFSGGADISKIVCDSYAVFLLMCDGTVYARNSFGIWGSGYSRPFEQIMFPEGEAIIKIVLAFCDIFFISAAGSCYYAKEYSFSKKKAIDAQIQGLCRYMVEDICEASYGWIVQHSGGRICILHTVLPKVGNILKLYPHNKRVFEQYIDGTKRPRSLAFFDNKTIVSVKILFNRTYFVTDEGHAYWTKEFDEETEPIITRDLYFDDNPIAVKRGTQSIRSARSILTKV